MASQLAREPASDSARTTSRVVRSTLRILLLACAAAPTKSGAAANPAFSRHGQSSHLAATAGDDALWAEGFQLPGTDPDGIIRCMVANDRSVYVAGRFRSIGSVPASNIARWDGSTWSALGDGVDGVVTALAFWHGKLVATGEFTRAGGVDANHIAVWDGSTWSSLAAGLDHAAAALAEYGGDLEHGGDLYAAGRWESPADSTLYHLTRWDGAVWTPADPGFANDPPRGWPELQALTQYRGKLIVAGRFDHIADRLSYSVACWDGVAWSTLGASGAPLQSASSMATDGNDLYVSGAAYSDVPAQKGSIVWEPVHYALTRSIVRWDGGRWEPLPFGASAFAYTDPVSLAIFHGELIAAGYLGPRGVWRWDGQAWHLLGETDSTAPSVLAVFSNQLLAAGEFRSIAGVRAQGIAAWDGAGWHRAVLGAGISGSYEPSLYTTAVHACVGYGGEVVAGGSFQFAGSTPARSIAAWDGSTWRPLGSGIDGVVEALAVYNGDLVATGRFADAGGTAASAIARWNGESWSPLGPGLEMPFVGPPEGRALAVWNGSLIVGGEFTRAGGLGTYHVARWDGTSWRGMNGLFDGVNVLVVHEDTLVAGGSFRWNGWESVDHVARWDGSRWQPMGTGVDFVVTSLTTHGGELVAAGGLGAYECGRTARWNGTEWIPLGTGMDAKVCALASYAGSLFAGGAFGMADGNPAHYLARWDGAAWEPVGSGLDGAVLALFEQTGALYAGGSFSRAGGTPAAAIARWDGSPTPIAADAFEAAGTVDGVRLQWKLSAAAIGRVEAVTVQRAPASQGPYTDLTGAPLAPAPAMSFLDAGAEAGHAYWYRLQLWQHGGSSQLAGPVEVTFAGSGRTALFAPVVPAGEGPISIRYAIGGAATPVQLAIYDARGRLVRSLVRAVRPPGDYVQPWSRTGATGQRVARGIYIVRFVAGDVAISRKLPVIQ